MLDIQLWQTPPVQSCDLGPSGQVCLLPSNRGSLASHPAHHQQRSEGLRRESSSLQRLEKRVQKFACSRNELKPCTMFIDFTALVTSQSGSDR